MNSSSAFLINHTDHQLVSELVRVQFPQYRDLDIRYVATGWDNVMFRLGDHLAIRLPRRHQGLEPQAHEIEWLNIITEPLTVSHPHIDQVGKPSTSFPYPWTIVAWVEGIRSMSVSPVQRNECAGELGRQLALLHRTAPPSAPVNPYRGTPLRERDQVIRKRIREVRALEPLLPLWESAVNAPDFGGTKVWCHGDIHPGNYIVNPDHSLAGIVDFGDLTQGDPAVDLGTAWASFDSVGRSAFLDAYYSNCSPTIAADPALITRAKGWVIATTISAVLVSDLSTPDFVEMARWAQIQLLGN